MHAGKLAEAVGAGGGPGKGQRERKAHCLEHKHGSPNLCVKRRNFYVGPFSGRKYQHSMFLSIPLLVSEPSLIGSWGEGSTNEGGGRLMGCVDRQLSTDVG